MNLLLNQLLGLVDFHLKVVDHNGCFLENSLEGWHVLVCQ